MSRKITTTLCLAAVLGPALTSPGSEAGICPLAELVRYCSNVDTA